MNKVRNFLFLSTVFLSATAPLEAIRSIELDSSVLKFVDGTSFINIGNIFGYGKNIRIIVEGTSNLSIVQQLADAYQFNLPLPLAEANHREGRWGLVLYGNEYLTAREVEVIEASGTGDPVLLEAALVHAISHFEKISVDYIEEIQVGKAYMVKLIEDWSRLRDRPDTILLNWSRIDHSERDSLHNTIKDFRTLNRFFGDLELFLIDLIKNCPRSHKAYRDSLKEKGVVS